MKRTLTNRLARLEREMVEREMHADGGGIQGYSSHINDELRRRAADCGLIDKFGRILIDGDERTFLAGCRTVMGGCPDPFCRSLRWDSDHEPECRWA